MQSAQPGAAVQQSLSRMIRSSDGKIRYDSPESSVIVDLMAQQTTFLDHLKKEASVYRMPQVPGGQFGGLSGLPDGGLMKSRLVNVQDLGKSMIDGQEVFGKRFTFQPPGAPTMPRAPSLPNMPQAPGLPKTDYTVSEIWTSTKLQLPVYTKTTGSFGEQIRRCRYVESGEPNPAAFQIPAGYKPPEVPAMPTAPAAPSLPNAPAMPTAPAAPVAPSLPGVPKVPGISR